MSCVEFGDVVVERGELESERRVFCWLSVELLRFGALTRLAAQSETLSKDGFAIAIEFNTSIFFIRG